MEITDASERVVKERTFEIDGPFTIAVSDGSDLEVRTCSVHLKSVEDGSTTNKAKLVLLLVKGQEFTITEQTPHLTFGHVFVLGGVVDQCTFLYNEHKTDWTLTLVRRYSDGELVVEYEHKF